MPVGLKPFVNVRLAVERLPLSIHPEDEPRRSRGEPARDGEGTGVAQSPSISLWLVSDQGIQLGPDSVQSLEVG